MGEDMEALEVEATLDLEEETLEEAILLESVAMGLEVMVLEGTMVDMEGGMEVMGAAMEAVMVGDMGMVEVMVGAMGEAIMDMGVMEEVMGMEAAMGMVAMGVGVMEMMAMILEDMAVILGETTLDQVMVDQVMVSVGKGEAMEKAAATLSVVVMLLVQLVGSMVVDMVGEEGEEVVLGWEVEAIKWPKNWLGGIENSNYTIRQIIIVFLPFVSVNRGYYDYLQFILNQNIYF